MTQAITVKIPLQLTVPQVTLLEQTSMAYIQTINALVAEMVAAKQITKKTSKDISAQLNSSVKNQAIKDAKSVFQKVKKSKYAIIPILKKPQVIWNNQNYRLKEQTIELPFIIEGKSKRIALSVNLTERMRTFITTGKLGTIRITKKNHKWIAQVSVTLNCEPAVDGQTMGIDLGLLVPAVSKTTDGKVKFFGNGRQNKFYKRKYKTHRKKLGKLKKPSAIKKLNNKEQRYMDNQDHKVSRDIINYAKANNVQTIHLECLSGIRNTTKISRKNKKNLHTWSFYRLAQYIMYKAKLAGIEVMLVDLKYTSQKCPNCGEKHKATGRAYRCLDCGFHTHRDLVGATNILTAPVISGSSLSA